MSDYLPPVVARLSMDMGDFLSGIAKAKAAIKGLNGDFKIGTDGLDAAATKVAALSKSLQGLSANIRVTTDGLGTVGPKAAAAAAATTAATGIMIRGWRLTGNAIHWIIAGGAELLAVTLPALVALGAGAAVMMQGWVNVGQHVQSVYTATEATANMFHVTAGQAMGLGNALQKAQDAANPAVYGMLGSAVITVNEHFGNLAQTGLDVTRMFQTFAAKVAVDFGPSGGLGNTMNHLLGNMTQDLQGLGQVLGNTGHALLNFADAMPGLAEWMLKGLSAITGFASHLAGFAGPLLTAAMGFEEFNRWGGLAATILTKFGLASASLSGGVFSLQRFASVVRGIASVVPAAARGIAALMAAMGATNGAIGLTKAASGLEGLIAKIGPLQAAIGVGAAVGLGILIDKMVTAKTAAQQLADSMQQATMKANNAQVFQVAAQNVATLSGKMAQVSVPALTATNAFKGLGAAVHNAAQQNLSQLHAGLTQQETDMRNVAEGAQFLAKTYGTTFQGALALASQANVKLASGILGTSQAAMVARMQIQSLVQGYKSMGQSTGEVGADMTAMAIQSGLAASQVGKLNSAWDDFTTNLTGGTSALSALTLGLTNLSTGANKVTNVLGKTKDITLSVQQFAGALKGMGTTGAQAWQNFNGGIQSGQKMLDWLRTAGAEVPGLAGSFKQAGLDMASAFVPLAAQSKTAQAELLGLVQQVDPSIQTFGQLKAAIAGSGASFSGLAGIVGTDTQKMANMNSVAQTLGNVLSTALVAAMQAAQVSASGAGAAMQKYSQDLMDGNRAAASADYSNLLNDLEKLGLSAQQAATLIAQTTQNLHALNGTVANAYINVTTRQFGGGSTGLPTGTAGVPGHAKGTPSASPGWAWVGEAGPELVKFRGGETVLPNQVSMGYANGAGGVEDQHIHVYLDGREIQAAVSKRSVAAQRRTGHNGMSRRTR